MPAGQVAAAHGRLQAPIVIVLLVGAFAVGGLAGFSLPRAAGSSHVDAAAGLSTGAAIPGVAVNNMSDAADRAFRGLASGAAIPGVAVNNMQKAFHLEKVCDTATHCVVTSSSFKAIPAGTEITYSGPDANHLTAVITVKNGTATGHCAIGSLVGYGDPSLPARCTFNRGTGRLSQFHLNVKVTTTAQFNPWYWDGTYWFGNGGPRRP
jgi:hypothetical protein